MTEVQTYTIISLICYLRILKYFINTLKNNKLYSKYIYFTFAPVDWLTKHGWPEFWSAFIIHPRGVSLTGLTFVFNDGVLSLDSYNSSSNSANGDELWLWLPELIVPALLGRLILFSYVKSKKKN